MYEKNVLNDKGFAYFNMTVTSYIFDGSQALAVKVLPEQYGSDPDLFISTVSNLDAIKLPIPAQLRIAYYHSISN